MLALVALLAGCASIDHDDWRFRLSRSSYQELFEKMDANEPVFDGERLCWSDSDEGWGLFFVPAVLVAPLVLDVVFLPVTVPHDLWARK
jgi:hypothetical protein